MRKKIYEGILLILVIAGVSINAEANFVDTYGMSARSMSQGNAVSSNVNNWSAVYYNIAGLGRAGEYKTVRPSETRNLKALTKIAQQSQQELDESADPDKCYGELAFNYMATMPQVKLSGINSTLAPALNSDYLNFGAIGVGLVIDLNHFIELPKPILSSARFGLSAGVIHDFYSTDVSLIKLNSVDPVTHNFVRYGTNAQRIVIYSGFGFGFMDNMFGVGIGINSMAGGGGNIAMNDILITPSTQRPLTSTFLKVTASVAPVAGFYFDFGKATAVLDGLNIGASYRYELAMKMDLTAGANMTVGGLGMEMAINMFEYYTPHTFVGGISYRIPAIPIKVVIAADFEYQLWSKYKMGEQASFYYNNIGIKDIKLQDVMIPKVGLTVVPVEWLSIMLGYNYQTSMLPDSEVKNFFNYMDNVKHTGSLGFGFKIPQVSIMRKPIEIIIAGQCQYLVTRSVVKNATYARSAPYNDTIPCYDADYNPNYKYGGIVPSASIEVSIPW